ncbi:MULTISPECIES: hypothetical protein [unclassified Leptolyngbya]|uniref:hypothetical protein n=1 Tax=unclassified Leptolyngbya TaxID=2650499 RepID=UPI00168890CA|nr:MULTISPECIES: hypothetical protein [unclassified Leptolyngbya]MBD1911241.1 hypothetical protein [Leptolyngbya sp. FACHB-8]MBD2155488.1 hypothetical protein [Leptolyngbya sp. FACHB-16]
MNYEIPVHLLGPLQAIAQNTGLSLEDVMEKAIAFYLNRFSSLPPSMSAGLSYEDLESEPDEILSDFLDVGSSRVLPTIPSSTDPDFSVTKRPPTYESEDDDEPYEILPGFLEP